jgi:hypothetical protein
MWDRWTKISMWWMRRTDKVEMELLWLQCVINCVVVQEGLIFLVNKSCCKITYKRGSEEPPAKTQFWQSWHSIIAKIQFWLRDILCSLFLGAFAKLRKATTSFFMSVRPSVCLSVRQFAWNNSTPTDGFSWNYTFEHTFVNCPDVSIFIKIWQE